MAKQDSIGRDPSQKGTIALGAAARPLQPKLAGSGLVASEPRRGVSPSWIARSLGSALLLSPLDQRPHVADAVSELYP